MTVILRRRALRGIRRYHTACAARAIAELGWDDEGTLTADLHGGDTFVPTGDDPLSADGELKWPAAVERAVKFLALGAALIEPAGVMHHADLTRARGSPGAHLGVGDLQ